MSPARASLLLCSTGFLCLSLEVLWVRVFSFASRSDPRIFGLFLGIYLLGLAGGTLLHRRRLSRRGRGVSLGIHLCLAGILSYLVVPGTVWLSSCRFYGWKAGLLLAAVASLASGGLYPRIMAEALGEESSVGRRVGLLSGANIAGTALGSLLTGFLLLDTVPTGFLAMGCSACFLLLGALMADHGDPGDPFSRGGAAAGLIFLSLTYPGFHGEMWEKLHYMPRYRTEPSFAEVVETKEGILTVTEGGVVYGGGAYDGVFSTAPADQVNPEIDHAYFLALLHRSPGRILEIGLATGTWARVLLCAPGVEHLTAVEINPGYLPLIAGRRGGSSLLDDPRFRWAEDDGRRWLRRHPGEKFDLVVLNTTFHWRSGATALLSSEFLALVKEHLNPGGIVYLNTTGSAEAAATVEAAFPYTLRRGIYIAASLSPLAWDPEEAEEALLAFRIDGEPVITLPGDEKALRKVLTLPGGRGAGAGEGERRLITDDNMITEFPRPF